MRKTLPKAKTIRARLHLIRISRVKKINQLLLMPNRKTLIITITIELLIQPIPDRIRREPSPVPDLCPNQGHSRQSTKTARTRILPKQTVTETPTTQSCPISKLDLQTFTTQTELKKLTDNGPKTRTYIREETSSIINQE